MNLPVTDPKDWIRFESADVGDIGIHIRCIECQQSDFVSYHITHLPSCNTARILKEKIDKLTPLEYEKYINY